MKIFISSLIREFEEFRDAAAQGVATLGHQVIRAEDLGASSTSSQVACLAEVRDSDALVLIMGSHYGPPQSAGLSATHEEYREARETKPVLVFIQQGIEPEPSQAAFIREVQNWEEGLFVAKFRDANELREKVTKALHEYILANESAPLDETEIMNRAKSLLSAAHSTSDPDLLIAVAGGPLRSVLRPAELESEELRHFLMAEALTGSDSVLAPSLGTESLIKNDAIQLVQNRGSGLVSLDETANLLIVQPATEARDLRSGFTSLIEELITERITRAIRFSARVFDHIDSTQRISHIVPVVSLRGVGYIPWRTRAEDERNPNSAPMGFGRDELIVVALSPPIRRRVALHHDTQILAEDFTVRLRREVKR